MPKIQKNPPQGLDFWKLEEFPQNPKIKQIPRVSKIPNLGVDFFGFLEFWKLEEFARFLDFEEIPRVSKIPKFQKFQPKFRIFGNSSGGLKMEKIEQIPRVSKIPNLGLTFFGFLEFWKLEEFLARFLDFEEIPRVSKKIPKTPTQVSDFWKLEREPQNPKIGQVPRVSKTPNLGVGFFGFLEFWKLEEFARFLDFEAPARVSKNPNLWGECLDVWIFGFLETGFLIRVFQGFLYDSLLCFRLPIKFNNTPVHFNGSPYLINKTPNQLLAF